MGFLRASAITYGGTKANIKVISSKECAMAMVTGFQQMGGSSTQGTMSWIRRVAMENFNGITASLCIRDISNRIKEMGLVSSISWVSLSIKDSGTTRKEYKKTQTIDTPKQR